MLNFWASWCEPCRDESPLLDRWHEKVSAGGRGTVLGVDVLDVSDDARDFVREFDLSYPMLRDGDGEVLGDYGVIAYPETFVIDRRGRIVASRRGPVDEAFMRREVAPLRGAVVRRRAGLLAALFVLAGGCRPPARSAPRPRSATWRTR